MPGARYGGSRTIANQTVKLTQSAPTFIGRRVTLLLFQMAEKEEASGSAGFPRKAEALT